MFTQNNNIIIREEATHSTIACNLAIQGRRGVIEIERNSKLIVLTDICTDFRDYASIGTISNVIQQTISTISNVIQHTNFVVWHLPPTTITSGEFAARVQKHTTNV